MKTQTMKNKLAVALCAAGVSAAAAQADDLQWLQTGIAEGKIQPFSFVIDGAPARVKFLSVETKAEEGWPVISAAYSVEGEPLTLALSARFSPDREFCRLTLALKGGATASRELYQIRILDLALPKDILGKSVTLHGVRGGFAPVNDHGGVGGGGAFPIDSWRPWSHNLRSGGSHREQTGMTGRSSDTHIPVWLLAGEKSGFWTGAEWSGASGIFVRNTAEAQLQVLLPTFAFQVLPNEEITLPTVALGCYQGSYEDGYNSIRRSIHQYCLPAVDGKKPGPRVMFQGLGAFPDYQDEAGLYKEAECAAKIGCENFIMDAGWNFPPKAGFWGPFVGVYDVHPDRFPQGIKKFNDMLQTKGMQPGIWIEPRFRDHVPAVKANPGLFYAPRESATLVDLSKPEARAWYFALLEKLINDYGSKGIWFDFNCEPRKQFWDTLEKPGRRGLMELAWFQGYYAVMDQLLAKYPGLWIENCASGGHMIDLGILRRSHSYWISDNSHSDDINRSMRGGASLILPAVYIQNAFFLHWTIKGGIPKPEDLTLSSGERFLNYFAGDLQFGQGLLLWNEKDLATAAQYEGLYKQYRHYLERDYYRLFPMPMSLRTWDGWQFHDPATGSGILIVFRLAENENDNVLLPLARLGNLADYEFSVAAGAASVTTVPKGLSVKIPGKGGACLIHYRKK